MQYKDFLSEALQDASKIANKYFGNVSGSTKQEDNNQVLTEADIEIGKLLINKVRTAFPDFNIIDEEAGVIDNNSDYTWVIDPIDGTSNFANKVPTYGIMMGLLKNATPIAGGFALPSTGEICIAEKGEGAYCNDERIFVTKELNLLHCLVAYHIDGHQEDPNRTREESKLLGEIILNIRNLRTTGSEPVDALLVARGYYGGLLNQTCKIWDVVAPQIILEEAGGLYTDFYGKQIDYTQPLTKTHENFTVCSGSPVLHKQLQKIISHQL